MYYLAIFVASLLICTGLIFLKSWFFNLAITATSLLNVILDSELDEDAKQKSLIKNLGPLLLVLLKFILGFMLAIGIALIPILIEERYGEPSQPNGLLVLAGALAGGVLPFVLVRSNQDSDYSDWSKLLHRIILNNYNISKALFKLEVRSIKKKKPVLKEYVLVTGLARAGTTALTNLLNSTGKFYSLSYSNMPFLLSVRLWRKLYKPKKQELKTRAHGDGIKFGLNTIEALEEYFFKVFSNDEFIAEDHLRSYNIEETTYNAYRLYQELIRPKDHQGSYLAKNNNLILRYRSMRELDKRFHAIVIFRDPMDHTNSLINQHERFSELHENDPFTLEYMNWLGHHEFGGNHKPFHLPVSTVNEFKEIGANHWLASWCDYYGYVLELAKDDGIHLVDYSNLVAQPERLIEKLSVRTGIQMSLNSVQEFKPSNYKSLEVDPRLKARAEEILVQLKELAI